jgi:hypothetical protein
MEGKCSRSEPANSGSNAPAVEAYGEADQHSRQQREPAKKARIVASRCSKTPTRGANTENNWRANQTTSSERHKLEPSEHSPKQRAEEAAAQPRLQRVTEVAACAHQSTTGRRTNE